MTQYGLPFDGVLTGDATKAPYSAAEWARTWQLQHDVGTPFPNYGVFKGSGDGTHEALEVAATNPVSSNVEVQIGSGLVQGYFYENTAVVTLAINANASGNARIDTVVLRLDYVAQTVRLVVVQGTPAASPARPTLTQNSTYWEVPLADIAVANGFATLAYTTITHRRRDVITASRGWQPYAYPLTYLVNADYDASTIALSSNGHSVAIPYVLGANMLIEDILFRIANGAVAGYVFGWDIYAQDANDGNTAENTLRRVARSNGNATGSTPGAPASYTLGAAGGAIALPPGNYWLVIQRRAGGSATISVGSIVAAGPFSPNICKTKVTTDPNGDTLDFATGWTNQTRIPGVIMRGRVFGQTAFY